jgi:hypothetical protein
MTKRVEELTRQLFNKWMREQELADRETIKEQMKKDKEEFHPTTEGTIKEVMG